MHSCQALNAADGLQQQHYGEIMQVKSFLGFLITEWNSRKFPAKNQMLLGYFVRSLFAIDKKEHPQTLCV
jgi:hypothetical protein